ncbi:MAG: aldo/keto reductase [Methylobacteriaceae bacterium]|nr:aldo/keto reductase [Methylobacteriaceae bacterium]
MNPAEPTPLGKTGLNVTRMGMGTGPLGMVHDGTAWAAIFAAAWSAGVRTFDTSPYYGFGNSEGRLGRLLAAQNRRDYVLATKVGRLLRPDAPIDPFAEAFYYPEGLPEGVLRSQYDYSVAATRLSLVESRQRLGIDRIDIAHIHDIVELASGISHVREAMHETYPALAELRDKGEISAVGVGAQVNSVLVELGTTCDFDCFLIAGRYTMLDQSAIDEVMPLCLARNIAVIIGSPYNTGILHDPTPNATFDFVQAPSELIGKAQQLKAICDRHRVPLPAAAIQFPFAHPAVAQVLTGARSAAEIKENVQFMRVQIPPELWRDLRKSGLIHPKAPLPGGL